eukprot:466704_1
MTPGIKKQKSVLKVIVALLFGHKGYCYSYYNVISLCNEILQRFYNHEYDIQQSLFCMKALSRFLKDGGTGQGKCRLQLQQMQIAATAMMHINNEGVLLNRQLVQNAIPHQNIKSIKPFIDGCINRRLTFDKKESKFICKIYSNETREPRLHLVIKQSIWTIFIDLCKLHPSLQIRARDMNRTVLDLPNGERKKYKARIFNQTKKWFHKRWKNKYKVLEQKHLGEKGLSYPSFIRWKPSHCVHRGYISLMACDIFRAAVDKVIKKIIFVQQMELVIYVYY